MLNNLIGVGLLIVALQLSTLVTIYLLINALQAFTRAINEIKPDDPADYWKKGQDPD